MIARDLRLRSPLDFERTRSEGRSWSSGLLVAVVRGNERGANRYGFAVGRKVGSAVHRNRAKRLMRESARHLHPSIAPGHDIVFIARNRVDRKTTYDEIHQAMRAVLDRAGILKDGGDESAPD